MNGGEDFVGFADEMNTIFAAASSIDLQLQIRIGTLQLFQGHTCFGLVFEKGVNGRRSSGAEVLGGQKLVSSYSRITKPL